MAFCRFCGKDLVNGQCSCPDFQASIGNVGGFANAGTYQEAYSKNKDPFLVQGFKPDFASVSSFISSVRNQSGMSEPSSSIGDPYEHNVPIVPDCIAPEENEITIKQYNVAKLRTRLKFMKSEGRLMVTNRRLLFRASGTSLTGNILQEHQFKIDEIGGVEMHKDYKFSLLNLFGALLLSGLAMYVYMMLFAKSARSSEGIVAMGVIFGLALMIPFFIVYKRFWLKLFCSMIASSCLETAFLVSNNKIIMIFVILSLLVQLVNTIIVCFVPNLLIRIKTNGAEGAVVIGAQSSLIKRKTGGEEYTSFAEVLPWEDTVMVINELGTMIDDIQKMGDYAIEKWSK